MDCSVPIWVSMRNATFQYCLRTAWIIFGRFRGNGYDRIALMRLNLNNHSFLKHRLLKEICITHEIRRVDSIFYIKIHLPLLVFEIFRPLGGKVIKPIRSQLPWQQKNNALFRHIPSKASRYIEHYHTTITIKRK